VIFRVEILLLLFPCTELRFPVLFALKFDPLFEHSRLSIMFPIDFAVLIEYCTYLAWDTRDNHMSLGTPSMGHESPINIYFSLAMGSGGSQDTIYGQISDYNKGMNSVLGQY